MRWLILLILLIQTAFSAVIFNHNGFGNGYYISDKLFITNTHIANFLDKYFYVYENNKNYYAEIEEIYDLGDDISLIKTKQTLNLPYTPILPFENQTLLDVKGYYYYSPFSYPLAYFNIDYNPLTEEKSNNWISWFGVITYGYSGSGVFYKKYLVGLLSCMDTSNSQAFATMITKEKYQRIKAYENIQVK